MLTDLDYAVLTIYMVCIVGLASYISRGRKGHERDTKDYFLAGRFLPWWAIGASLVAANISAEQIIGMSGSGYVIGLAIASYEWMSALTLIIVGKYFLPTFLEQRIYTMPQFLKQRYGDSVCMLMAIFWLLVYIFVNLTSILWLGALAITSMSPLGLEMSLFLLGGATLAYSLYGGLQAVAMTDIVQIVLIVVGGAFIVYLGLNELGGEAGAFSGLTGLLQQVPEKFDLILDKQNPHYMSLPGISVLVGGMWIMNISYWGCNQYIIQRALAAKNIQEAQKGIVFAAYLKLLTPVIVVLPGIMAVVLSPGLEQPDKAYFEIMQLVPTGIRGLIFAALVAAILSSIASMLNSSATIFTMDIYKKMRPAVSESHLVRVGRFFGVFAIITAILMAKPLLGNFDQAFQYIQEFTGFFTPGIVVIFILGMFWKPMTAAAALAATLSTVILSLLFKLFWPTLPFMDRVGLVFLLCMAIAIILSLSAKQKTVETERLQRENFSTSRFFNIMSMGVIAVLITLYTLLW